MCYRLYISAVTWWSTSQRGKRSSLQASKNKLKLYLFTSQWPTCINHPRSLNFSNWSAGNGAAPQSTARYTKCNRPSFIDQCANFIPLSRRSRQRERLHATGVSSSSVCLSVAKTPKRDFLKNSAISSYGLYWRPIGSRTWAFQRTHYWTPKIKIGGDPPFSDIIYISNYSTPLNSGSMKVIVNSTVR